MQNGENNSVEKNETQQFVEEQYKRDLFREKKECRRDKIEIFVLCIFTITLIIFSVLFIINITKDKQLEKSLFKSDSVCENSNNEKDFEEPDSNHEESGNDESVKNETENQSQDNLVENINIVFTIVDSNKNSVFTTETTANSNVILQNLPIGNYFLENSENILFNTFSDSNNIICHIGFQIEQTYCDVIAVGDIGIENTIENN